MRRGRVLGQVLVVAVVLVGAISGAAPVGAAVSGATGGRAATSATHTIPVPMSCTGDDQSDGGALNHAFSNLVVTATAPTVVPFGGSLTVSNFGIAVTAQVASGTRWVAAGAGVTLGWPSHTIHASNEVGAYGFVSAQSPLVAGTAARLTSSLVATAPIDVIGNVGDVVQVPLDQIQVSVASAGLPPFVPPEEVTMNCTPSNDPVTIAVAVIGPPPGGALPTDYVVVGAKDTTTGLSAFQASGFVKSGNFVSGTDGTGYPTLYGSATLADSRGGTATVTLLLSFKPENVPGGFVAIPLFVMHVSDPSMGVSFDASSSDQRVLTSNENFRGIAGGTSTPGGDPLAVQWVVRDLAFR